MMAPAPAAGAAGRGVRLGADTLSRLLDDLGRAGSLERRRDGERHLCEYVEAEARDLSADAFGKFMTEVYARLQAMIKRCGGAAGTQRGCSSGGARARQSTPLCCCCCLRFVTIAPHAAPLVAKQISALTCTGGWARCWRLTS